MSPPLRWPRLLAFMACLFATLPAMAAEPPAIDLTTHWAGYAAIVIFALAYVLVIAEEFTHLRKSQPVMLAAGAMWALLAIAAAAMGQVDSIHVAVGDYLLEYAELLLFLLAAMTYVNAMSERNLFEALRMRLLQRGLGYRQLFWATGALAFCMSPMIDNLTTALVMCAVVLAVGRDSPKFVTLACINIVVAANAGGAFSPFGDITTLMVWQRGVLHFWDFFHLFVPALVNWLVPAICMHFAVTRGMPAIATGDIRIKSGGLVIAGLFVLTVLLAVCFHNFLDLPPFMGMMTGLALLKLYGWHLTRKANAIQAADFDRQGAPGDVDAFDSYEQVARAEWDTLRDHVRRRPGLLRLPGAGIAMVLWRSWSDHRERADRRAVGSARQHPDDGRGAANASAHGYRSMAVGDDDGGCWRQPAVDWVRGGRRVDGPGEGQVHLLQPPALELGDRVGVCGQHWRAPAGKCAFLHRNAGIAGMIDR
jgi:hypothetical protein